MATVINGSDLMLFIDEKSIAFATNHKLSISVETIETSSKDHTGSWVAKVPRKKSWNVTTENLYSVDGAGSNFDDLFGMIGTEVQIVFTTSASFNESTGHTAATTYTYSGKATITSLEANAPDGDNATFTASFEGIGELTKTE